MEFRRVLFRSATGTAARYVRAGACRRSCGPDIPLLAKCFQFRASGSRIIAAAEAVGRSPNIPLSYTLPVMPQPRHAHARAFRDRPLPIGTADTRPRQTVNLVNFGGS